MEMCSYSVFFPSTEIQTSFREHTRPVLSEITSQEREFILSSASGIFMSCEKVTASFCKKTSSFLPITRKLECVLNWDFIFGGKKSKSQECFECSIKYQCDNEDTVKRFCKL